MVTLEVAEKASVVPQESGANKKEVAHWFYYTPCAGVTYYSFEKHPTQRPRVEPRAPGDTKTGIP